MDFVYTWYNISGKILLLSGCLVAGRKRVWYATARVLPPQPVWYWSPGLFPGFPANPAQHAEFIRSESDRIVSRRCQCLVGNGYCGYRAPRTAPFTPLDGRALCGVVKKVDRPSFGTDFFRIPGVDGHPGKPLARQPRSCLALGTAQLGRHRHDPPLVICFPEEKDAKTGPQARSPGAQRGGSAAAHTPTPDWTGTGTPEFARSPSRLGGGHQGRSPRNRDIRSGSRRN